MGNDKSTEEFVGDVLAREGIAEMLDDILEIIQTKKNRRCVPLACDPALVEAPFLRDTLSTLTVQHRTVLGP